MDINTKIITTVVSGLGTVYDLRFGPLDHKLYVVRTDAHTVIR